VSRGARLRGEGTRDGPRKRSLGLPVDVLGAGEQIGAVLEAAATASSETAGGKNQNLAAGDRSVGMPERGEVVTGLSRPRCIFQLAANTSGLTHPPTPRRPEHFPLQELERGSAPRRDVRDFVLEAGDRGRESRRRRP